MLPVIEALAAEVRVSIDTVKPAVARAAVAAGATLVNDVSASLAPVAAEVGAGFVVMHRQGDPKTMQVAPRYDDVVAEVVAFLDTAAAEARALGIDEVWVDPGIGFGKTLAHNLSLLRHLDRGGRHRRTGGRRHQPQELPRDAHRALRRLGRGPLRPTDRLEASLATATWAMAQGARMVRVHDVLPTVQAAKVVAA